MCLQCPQGTYSPYGSSTCLLTTAGYYAPYLGMSYLYGCNAAMASGAVNCDGGNTKCGSGQVYLDVTTVFGSEYKCTDVPAGYFSFPVNNMVYICPAGTSSDRGSSTCQDCPTSYFPGTAGCFLGLQDCPAGQNKVLGVCVDVSAGHYNPMAFSGAYYSCPVGYFSSSEGSTSCQPCGVGTFSTTPGAFTCLTCPDGYSSGQGQSSCFSCNQGYYAVNGGECLPCPPGTTSQGQAASCSVVPEGFYNFQYGLSYFSNFRCAFSTHPGAINCDPFVSNSCEEGFLFRNNECHVSPPGYFSPVAGSSILYICPAGSYSTSQATFCSPCADAVFPGTSLCESSLLECPIGQFSDSTICTDVPAGSFKVSSVGNAINSCPPGTFSKPGSTNCQSCSIGSNSVDMLDIGAEVCHPCPLGQYHSTDQYSFGVCVSCPAGTYRDTVKSQCSFCPPNTFSSLGMTECKQCPMGTVAYGNGNSYCSYCSANYYSAGFSNCNYCPYSLASGATNCLPGISGELEQVAFVVWLTILIRRWRAVPGG